ncbi:MAG: trypsin-like serine protease [Chloroflexaceae bacterium]|nr:trypsin-like serine protease [Chloroflexaceae bacterium]NJO08056.1 trypsin-like serine protease [Chloroflexaceae bacterium]
MTTLEIETPVAEDELQPSIDTLLQRVRASVVQVRNRARGVGAGVVWQINGAVLTNHHVVAGERGPIEILLTDGRSYEAHVVASNADLDLALLEVQQVGPGALPLVAVGDSTSLRVGELVFAIGHPWGQRDVVTAGIISGTGRVNIPGYAEPVPYVLSDVLLRPGNSGGPLVNANGGVIGINAMIRGGDLSVAIPSHMVIRWITALERIL